MKKLVALVLSFVFVIGMATVSQAAEAELIEVEPTTLQEIPELIEPTEEPLADIQASDYTYKMREDNQTIAITGYTGTEKSITIPTEINGYPVKELADEAFKDSLVESVVIPDHVTGFGGSIFAYCSELRYVKLPENMTFIPFQMFYRCRLLDNLEIPKNVSGVSQRAFEGCTALKRLEFFGESMCVDKRSFAYCTSLEEVIMHARTFAVEHGGYTFAHCYSLKKVQLPSEIDFLTGHMFYQCASLQSIDLPSTLTSISAYDFAGTGLRSITIPENVTHIGEGAFAECEGLANVVIQGPVKTIAKDAFKACYSLEDLTLPATLTKIESGSFYAPLPKLTIRGVTGSYAGSFAEEYGCKFISTGQMVLPKKPAGFKIKAYSGQKMRIWWQEDKSVTGYYVYRSTSNKSGTYKSIKLLKNVRAYTDKKLTVGQMYYYKIVPYVLVNGQKVKGPSSGAVKATAK